MKVVWTDRAEADRHRVWMFLSDRSLPYADRVEARVLDRCASLAGVPRQGRPVGGDQRDLSIPDVQLVVRYRIDEEAGVVRIIGVRSTRENREQP